MKSELRERALLLRKIGRLSYSAISKKIDVSKSTLSYWLADLPLKESEIKQLRKRAWEKGETARERFRNSMRVKKDKENEVIYEKIKKEILPIDSRDLYIAGLILYVGEGDKRNRHRIALANNDPAVVAFFTKWLQKFSKIPREKIRFGLHLYENMNIAKERKFWQDALGFGGKSFYKDQIRSLKTTFSYSEGSRHGTCTVYVIGTKPKTEIMQAIRVLFDTASVVQW